MNQTRLLGALLFIFALSSCDGSKETKVHEVGSSDGKIVVESLQADFRVENLNHLLEEKSFLFGLFFVDAPREATDGIMSGYLGNLVKNKGGGFSMEPSTSQFPAPDLKVTFDSNGVSISYWSQVFLSNDEIISRETIEKNSVYRLYRGYVPKGDFLGALQKNVDGSIHVYDTGFFVMKMTKEQKEKP